jgi:hypothetical protein
LEPDAICSVLGYFVDVSLGPRAYQDFVSAIVREDDTEQEVVVTETSYSPTDIFVQYALQRGVLLAAVPEGGLFHEIVHTQVVRRKREFIR